MEQEKLSIRANMIWNSVGSFTYLFSQWLLTVVIVKIAGYGVNGQFSLAMSLTNIFGVIANYSMRNYQISDVKGHYTQGSYVFSRYVTCVIGLVCCIGFTFVNGYSFEQALIIIVYMIFRISESFVDVLHGIDQKMWRMDLVGKSLLIRSVLTFFAFTVLLSATQNLIYSIIGMSIIAYTVILFYDMPKSKKLVHDFGEIEWKAVWKLLIECFPLVIYMVMSNSIISIPRYFLEKMHSEEMLGIYATIATPTLIVQVAAAYLFSPLITVFAEMEHEKDIKGFMKLFGKITIMILGVSVAAVLGCIVLGDWGLQLLFGKDILAYSYLLIPVMLCTILNAFIWFLCALLTVLRDFKGLIIANVIGVIICVAGSLLLIPSYGMDGVNYVLYLALPVEISLLVFFGIHNIRSKDQEMNVLK